MAAVWNGPCVCVRLSPLRQLDEAFPTVGSDHGDLQNLPCWMWSSDSCQDPALASHSVRGPTQTEGLASRNARSCREPEERAGESALG